MSNELITSIWSSYGHHFIGTDCPEHDSCLICGAMYALVPDEDDPTRGAYMTASGDEPQHCTGDTSMVHGYPGERYCHEHDGGECEHTEHGCNCLFCDS